MIIRESSPRPVLSIVVVVFNMKREAPRTLFTLTEHYQKVSSDLYEVLVVDNGSTPPLGAETVHAIDERFRYYYLDPSHPSPASALNYGARMAAGRLLGFMVDGARMLSPGILHYAIRASRAYHDPLVSTLGFHLGPQPQVRSVLDGYNQDVEDRLLESVDWRNDGYELFRIASFAGSAKHGWFAPVSESNCVFVTRNTFEALGGFGESFDLPGGGLVNHDFYRRASELPQTEPVMLLGEATFHQYHGGAMTGKKAPEVGKAFQRLAGQYRRIRGREYERTTARYDYLGHAPPSVRPSVHDSFERFEGFRQRFPGPASAYEHGSLPPNPLKAPSAEPRVIVILGMHRSGTSVLAGSLQEAGLALGDVVTNARNNPKGNRENRAIMYMQEDLLRCNGGSWDHPPETVRWGRLHKAVRDLFIAHFTHESLWGFKDPRTLLTLEGWLDVLPAAELVGIFRHPARVALSLKRRNHFPIEQGLHLWQVYNEKLLRLHQDHRFPLIEFHTEASGLRNAMQHLVRILDLPLRHRPLTFFDERLRRQSTGEIALPPDAHHLYEKLQQRVI